MKRKYAWHADSKHKLKGIAAAVSFFYFQEKAALKQCFDVVIYGDILQVKEAGSFIRMWKFIAYLKQLHSKQFA
ncbi:hypothetical protein [Paenibacillus algorifonticola]|uniref:hypothetical protein n=1 Tax=Paenibacillus algorifonticola TaxID=684063 RepID=UPI0006196D31|nr:hypothetical protein [Paenibacillus algorifonticola]